MSNIKILVSGDGLENDADLMRAARSMELDMF